MLQAKVFWEKFGRYAHVPVGLACAHWVFTIGTEQAEEFAFFGMIALGVFVVELISDFGDTIRETTAKSLPDIVALSVYRFSLQVCALFAVFALGGQLYLWQIKNLTPFSMSGLPAWVDTTTLTHSAVALICSLIAYRMYEIVFMWQWAEDEEDAQPEAATA